MKIRSLYAKAAFLTAFTIGAMSLLLFLGTINPYDFPYSLHLREESPSNQNTPTPLNPTALTYQRVSAESIWLDVPHGLELDTSALLQSAIDIRKEMFSFFDVTDESPLRIRIVPGSGRAKYISSHLLRSEVVVLSLRAVRTEGVLRHEIAHAALQRRYGVIYRPLNEGLATALEGTFTAAQGCAYINIMSLEELNFYAYLASAVPFRIALEQGGHSALQARITQLVGYSWTHDTWEALLRQECRELRNGAMPPTPVYTQAGAQNQ